jgi:V/A-type H+-transporting ATPase subunit E
MSGLEKISEAILDKVKIDAQNIIKEAKERAQERIKKAEQQQKARLEEERDRLIAEATEEAARITAHAAIAARQELLVAKTKVINKIIAKVKKTLPEVSGNEPLLLNLIREAISTAGIEKAVIYVSPKDVSSVQKLLRDDKQLIDRIEEVKEINCSGGVVVEDVGSKIKVDNTYNTRLEMLLPKLLPEIAKELFQDNK